MKLIKVTERDQIFPENTETIWLNVRGIEKVSLHEYPHEPTDFETHRVTMNSGRVLYVSGLPRELFKVTV